MPIENKLITNTIESAQKKLEASNFAIRKQVLQYDDVMNQQREIIYKQRQMVLDLSLIHIWQIAVQSAQSKKEMVLYRGAKPFAPAGQSTQMIIGATPETWGRNQCNFRRG